MTNTPDPAARLLPCPFCGRELIVGHHVMHHPPADGKQMFCILSHMTVREEHAEFWNRRHGPALLGALAWRPIASAPEGVKLLVFGTYTHNAIPETGAFTAWVQRIPGRSGQIVYLDPSPHDVEYSTEELSEVKCWQPLPTPPKEADRE